MRVGMGGPEAKWSATSGSGKFLPKIPNFSYFFLLGHKNIIGSGQKMLRVKAGFAPFLLRVRCMHGSGIARRHTHWRGCIKKL